MIDHQSKIIENIIILNPNVEINIDSNCIRCKFHDNFLLEIIYEDSEYHFLINKLSIKSIKAAKAIRSEFKFFSEQTIVVQYDSKIILLNNYDYQKILLSNQSRYSPYILRSAGKIPHYLKAKIIFDFSKVIFYKDEIIQYGKKSTYKLKIKNELLNNGKLDELLNEISKRYETEIVRVSSNNAKWLILNLNMHENYDRVLQIEGKIDSVLDSTSMTIKSMDKDQYRVFFTPLSWPLLIVFSPFLLKKFLHSSRNTIEKMYCLKILNMFITN